MEYVRTLDLRDLLARKSIFLLGPRGTGKSFLVRKQLSTDTVVVDLLRGDLFLRLSANPGDLEAIIDGDPRAARRRVAVDEIQRLPELLSEIHRLIEERKMVFLMTGSSARKLRRGGTNLLGGRAWTATMLPLTSREIPHFDLDRYLQYGGLPAVQLSPEPEQDLSAYVHTYLYEEVQAEGLVRAMPPFSRFLTTAALMNGQILNFAAIANAAGVPASTVREHYSVLVDTLIGFLVEPWTKSRQRKAIATAKFYFFDTGVTHALAGTRTLDRNSDLYGRSFEHWVAMEIRAYLAYSRRLDPMLFWRSTHGFEVDFVIGDRWGIEAKATRRVTSRDARGLRALRDELPDANYVLVSQDTIETRSGGLRAIHWKTFVRELWDGHLI